MLSKNIEEVKKFLEKIKDKEILILIDGFLNSKIIFKKMLFNINIDVLTINCEDESIAINLNQIYDVEIKENELKMYLDNDLIIKCISTK